ncbi:C-type natriuretic peptide 1-like [Varanus komodoensis]|uniref:C-type natriuretic peptide 1-like n=1 Tax=Varanus komodoensis TaxID=61221 RepID=UPI001CF7DEBD|nr:C-type natriuretic peptide 1-like [Varanus komodoensis]
MKTLRPAFFLALLSLASQAPIRSPQSLLEVLGAGLDTLLAGHEGPPARLPSGSLAQLLRWQPPLGGTPSAPQERAWIHFLIDFVNAQKTLRRRTKKLGEQGCFGFKLDRIGTLSGLGC